MGRKRTASMKPEHFCSGNGLNDGRVPCSLPSASMKPEHFCSGNEQRRCVHQIRLNASMKPEHFCSGNDTAGERETDDTDDASMKPEHFCSGNQGLSFADAPERARFNEAGAFLLRKLLPKIRHLGHALQLQ